MLSFGVGLFVGTVVGGVVTFAVVTSRTQRELRQLAHRTLALAERAARAAHELAPAGGASAQPPDVLQPSAEPAVDNATDE